MKPRSTMVFLLGLFFSGLLLFSANAELPSPVEQSLRVTSAALDSQGLAFAGRFGGIPRAIITTGTHIDAGQDAELIGLDARNPTSPSRIGNSMLTGVITKLVV